MPYFSGNTFVIQDGITFYLIFYGVNSIKTCTESITLLLVTIMLSILFARAHNKMHKYMAIYSHCDCCSVLFSYIAIPFAILPQCTSSV